jgi:hypothetical protein
MAGCAHAHDCSGSQAYCFPGNATPYHQGPAEMQLTDHNLDFNQAKRGSHYLQSQRASLGPAQAGFQMNGISPAHASSPPGAQLASASVSYTGSQINYQSSYESHMMVGSHTRPGLGHRGTGRHPCNPGLELHNDTTTQAEVGRHNKLLYKEEGVTLSSYYFDESC